MQRKTASDFWPKIRKTASDFEPKIRKTASRSHFNHENVQANVQAFYRHNGSKKISIVTFRHRCLRPNKK